MNRRIAGFCALIVFIALAFYGIQLPDAEKTREVTYVAELTSDPEKFSGQELKLLGNIRQENGVVILEDSTGSIEVAGNKITSTSVVVYGRYENGKLVAEAVQKIPFTKPVYVAIGAFIVIASFLFYWRFEPWLNVISRRK